MNAFDECQKIEMQGYQLIKPWLARRFDEFVYVQGAKRAEFLYQFQVNYGDLIAKKGDILVFIDIKTERENKYGNLFLETWSNKSRRTPGWFCAEGGVKADYIYYIFLKPQSLYILDLAKARDWAFIKGNLQHYPEKRQNKYDQLNDTWGRCVRIDDIRKAGIVESARLSAADTPLTP